MLLPHVEAVPTLLHGQPDGRTTLVRFFVTGVDAPAARLRVLASNGRLIGTAGLVRRGEALAGELWMPLTSAVTVRSDLETPVTRGVHRTSHRLTPTPRWTIRWVTLAEPAALRARFAEVPILLLGAESVILTEAGVRINPWNAAPHDQRDHLELIRIAAPAAQLAAATAVPLSARALVPPREANDAFLLRALEGSGITGMVDDRASVDPAVLGFAAGRARMVAPMEAWLGELHESGGAADRRTVTVIGDDPEFAVQAVRSLEEWNGLYAYPRIVVGDDDGGRAVRRHGGSGEILSRLNPPDLPPYRPTALPPVFAPLAAIASSDDPTLDGLARQFRLPIGGTLVFNPSPFGRSGVVELAGGGLRLVTDVPGICYAFLPDGDGGGGARGGSHAVRETLRPIETARFSVRLDERTGAIASLVERATNRELVAAGGSLNWLNDAVASHAWVERFDDVGVRIVARRNTPGAVVTSRVTIYHALPWVDVDNLPDDPGGEVGTWRFDLALAASEVRREVAGGVLSQAPPIETARALRWLALLGGDGTFLFGCADPRRYTVGVPAFGHTVLTAHGSRPTARFRLALQRSYLLADDPWRFGFGMRPMTAVAAPGSGDRALPTFGRLFDVADPATAVIGLKEADDGAGVIVYLMDVGGPARTVALRPGVLTFEDALITDLAERDRGTAPAVPDGGALVSLEPSGYAAARLLGVRLAL